MARRKLIQENLDKPIADLIRELLNRRAADASICPSEVARLAAEPQPDWRGLMPRVREVAADLASQGILKITRGRHELDAGQLSGGPIRLRRGRNWPTAF